MLVIKSCLILTSLCMLFEVDPLNLHYMTDIDNNGLTEKCQN